MNKKIKNEKKVVMFDVAMNCDTVYILKKVTWVLVLGYFTFFTSGFKFCFLFMM